MSYRAYAIAACLTLSAPMAYASNLADMAKEIAGDAAKDVAKEKVKAAAQDLSTEEMKAIAKDAAQMAVKDSLSSGQIPSLDSLKTSAKKAAGKAVAAKAGLPEDNEMVQEVAGDAAEEALKESVGLGSLLGGSDEAKSSATTEDAASTETKSTEDQLKDKAKSALKDMLK